MRLGGWLHRRLAWLALCLLVFGAFAPSLSKYLAAAQGVSWIEVCSASGAKRVALDFGSKKLPEVPMADDGHCGFCRLQHHTPFVPTDPYTWEAAAVSTLRLLIDSGGTPVFKRLTRDAHPTRAPPVFS